MIHNTYNYSPVFIPTLCRHEHLRQTLESLRCCTHAELTDVYIGLDYPLKEKHWDGYRKIDEYLKTVNGFKSLTVLRREHNFGSTKNRESALEMICSKYDSFIYMEDDNVVSPNFLDFINKGINRFQDEEDVIAISGYSYRNDFPCGKSNFYKERSGFNVWGHAMTSANYVKMRTELTRWYSWKRILNPYTLIYCAWYSWSSFLFLMLHAAFPRLKSDYVLSNYMLFSKKNMVMPAKSLLRNIGFDGSGEHCGAVDGFSEQEIDTRSTFDFIGDGMDNYWEIDRQLHLSKRSGMPFSKMCRHIYEMTRVHIFRLNPR